MLPWVQIRPKLVDHFLPSKGRAKQVVCWHAWQPSQPKTVRFRFSVAFVLRGQSQTSDWEGSYLTSQNDLGGIQIGFIIKYWSDRKFCQIGFEAWSFAENIQNAKFRWVTGFECMRCPVGIPCQASPVCIFLSVWWVTNRKHFSVSILNFLVRFSHRKIMFSGTCLRPNDITHPSIARRGHKYAL